MLTYIKGDRSSNMTPDTLDVRMRIAIHAPNATDVSAVKFAADVSDAYWLTKTTAPNRAAGAFATHAKRKGTSTVRAAETAIAKRARVDGSSNAALVGDQTEELTARVEFSSETHIQKNAQPTAITADLNGGVLAKLTYDEETGAESWDIGRVKAVITQSVLGPDGESQTNTTTVKWQIGLNGRGDIYELHLSIDSCGPKSEWIMVQSKPLPKTKAKRK